MAGDQLGQQGRHLRALLLVKRREQAPLGVTGRPPHFDGNRATLGRDPKSLATAVLRIRLAPHPALALQAPND